VDARARRRLILAPLALGLLLAPTVEATIEEQRERLPPPADCGDVVEGEWRSHRYSPQFRDWRIFTLTIRRLPGSETEVVGTIRNQAWDGGPDDEEPGPCGRTPVQWVVSTDARGTIRGNDVVFSGMGAWRLERVGCGHGPGGYNLDSFSGTIDPAIEEFQSVNNDGGRAVNEPTVFRRVRCFPPDAQPHIEVAPPPFFPRHASRGC
jgi:hypothetical protein